MHSMGIIIRMFRNVFDVNIAVKRATLKWIVAVKKCASDNNYFSDRLLTWPHRILMSSILRAKKSAHGSLQWRHNERDCLLNPLFKRRSKKTSKFRVTGLCAGNSPVTGEFPAQRASNAENVSIWWRHHGSHFVVFCCGLVMPGFIHIFQGDFTGIVYLATATALKDMTTNLLNSQIKTETKNRIKTCKCFMCHTLWFGSPISLPCFQRQTDINNSQDRYPES